MPKYVRITYQCPRCRTDIGRQFKLLTTRTIICPRCSAPVRIDTAVMAANWGFNFAWFGGLLVWFGLAAGVMLDTDFAAYIGGKTFPAHTFEQRGIIAMMSCVWGMIAAFFSYFVGVVIGAFAFMGAGDRPEEAEGQGQLDSAFGSGYSQGNVRLGTADMYGRPSPSVAPAPPQPQGRGCLIRMFFIVFWPIFYFVGYVIGVATYVSSVAKDQKDQEKLMHDVFEQATPWMLLGFLIVCILGCLGFLPWTGRGRRKAATPA